MASDSLRNELVKSAQSGSIRIQSRVSPMNANRVQGMRFAQEKT